MNCIRCSRCGKQVSTAVPDEIFVRAWVECPECLESQGTRQRLRVVTVRMPESLHRLLAQEADKRKSSINKLCVDRLRLMVRFVPDDQGGHLDYDGKVWRPENSDQDHPRANKEETIREESQEAAIKAKHPS